MAQKLPTDEDGKVVFEKVFEVPNKSKDVLFGKALDWLTKYYKSANDVIQLKDKERGKIIGKGIFTITHWLGHKWNASHTLTIRVKDNKLKIVIDQIMFRCTTMSGEGCSSDVSINETKHYCLGKSSFREMKIKVMPPIGSLLRSIRDHLNKEDNDDDW